MKKFAVTAVCCLALASAAGKASADEYCVSCAGPEAVYRCAIEGTPEGPGKDPRGQLLCITTLANSGRHESCSVARNPAGPCPGTLKVIAAPAGDLPALPPGLAPDTAGAGPSEPPAAGGPPRTVEELAGETVKSSKEGLESAGRAISGTAEKTGEAITGTAKKTGETIDSAGSAVGNAAKKTWDCLKSLFSDC